MAKANVVAWVSVLQAVTLVICLGLGYYLHGSLGAIAAVVGNRIFPSIAMVALAYRACWINLWKELRCIPAYAFGPCLVKSLNIFSDLSPTSAFGIFFTNTRAK